NESPNVSRALSICSESLGGTTAGGDNKRNRRFAATVTITSNMERCERIGLTTQPQRLRLTDPHTSRKLMTHDLSAHRTSKMTATISATMNRAVSITAAIISRGWCSLQLVRMDAR